VRERESRSLEDALHQADLLSSALARVELEMGTAVRVAEDLDVFVTYDARLGRAARAAGRQVKHRPDLSRTLRRRSRIVYRRRRRFALGSIRSSEERRWLMT
jgi:hypothetical protein